MHPDTLPFFIELERNNNREWFQANKARWDAIREEFTALTAQVIDALSPLDPTIGHPDPKRCVYRIYRDLRFSPDKTPYKTHFAVYIASGGVKQHGRPGYYLHIQNGESSFGGGIYLPAPELLDAIRKEIYYNIDSFKGIIGSKEYVKNFPSILWNIEKLKKAPQGFDPNFPDIDLLKHKHYVSVSDFGNETATADGFLQYIVKLVKATYPLNKFIQDVMFDLSMK